MTNHERAELAANKSAIEAFNADPNRTVPALSPTTTVVRPPAKEPYAKVNRSRHQMPLHRDQLCCIFVTCTSRHGWHEVALCGVKFSTAKDIIENVYHWELPSYRGAFEIEMSDQYFGECYDIVITTNY